MSAPIAICIAAELSLLAGIWDSVVVDHEVQRSCMELNKVTHIDCLYNIIQYYIVLGAQISYNLKIKSPCKVRFWWLPRPYKI